MTGPTLWTWARAFLGRLELQVLASIVAAGAAVMAFLNISGEVSEHETEALDRMALLWFRTPGHPADPIGGRAFEESMRDITALGGFTLLTLVTLVAAACLTFFGKRRQ